MKYFVNQIKWTDHQSLRTSCNLPTTLKIDDEDLFERGYLNNHMLGDAIADWLCDQFGYAVEKFNYKPTDRKNTWTQINTWKKA